jgi:hypothetical protein
VAVTKEGWTVSTHSPRTHVRFASSLPEAALSMWRSVTWMNQKTRVGARWWVAG